MKSKRHVSALRSAILTLLTAALFVSSLSFASVFADRTVSGSDISGGDIHQAPHSVVVTHRSPELLTSRDKRANSNVRSKPRKFLPSASYSGSYRSELTDNEQIIYDGFYSALVTDRSPSDVVISMDFDPVIEFSVVYSDAENDIADDRDIAGIDDTVLSAAAAFFYDCPEAFWVRAFNYAMYINFTPGSDTGNVSKIEISFPYQAYPDAYSDLAAYDSGLTAAITAIREARSGTSVYDTVKAIHDYICLNASYEYSALTSTSSAYDYAYTAAPLFTGKKKFVCEGYAKAMKILCGKFGIRCALVSGTGMTSESSGGPHMWNYVQMDDGVWYGVDATWDDAASVPLHDYFLVGSTTFVRNNRTFAQDHIPDGQVMSSPTKFSLIYPTLSQSAYNYLIVDEDPFITLTTLGASIRLTSPYGIRFGIQIKRDEGLRRVHIIPEFGTLIIASGTLGDNELVINTPGVLKIKADNIYSQDDYQYTYTGVLIGIPKANFNTGIKGRGYLIYIDPDTGEEHIIYSQTVERTFSGVARSAYDYYIGIQNPDQSQKEIISLLEGFLDNQ